MSDESHEGRLEHFAPTGGRVMGVVGLVMAAGLVGLWVLDRDRIPASVAAGALVGAVLVWASLLRPRVSASREALYLRNMMETVQVPLAAVDELVVRQVLVVRVGDKRFVSPAVGRKLRKVMRAPRAGQIFMPSLPEKLDDGFGPAESERPPTSVDYVDHVEDRLRLLVGEARARHGIQRYSDEAEALAKEVRRVPAWPEIAALVLSTALFVVTLVV